MEVVDEYVNFYAAWEPVRINAGLVSGEGSGETGGFFINSTGLQFTTAPGSSEASNQFGGWLGKCPGRSWRIVRC